jgi:hypothetical protein
MTGIGSTFIEASFIILLILWQAPETVIDDAMQQLGTDSNVSYATNPSLHVVATASS